MTVDSTPVREAFARGLARFDQPGSTRLGAELKFPLVAPDGTAASREDVQHLWRFLADREWTPQTEEGHLIGATRPGERNDTVGSSETGYCKVEFSLAHVADLHALDRQITDLRTDLREFTEHTDRHFLGCGIHPVTPPSPELRMTKKRASVWGEIFRSNEVIPPGTGDDMDLFTINAGSHVHVSLPPGEAISAVNVLNGFAPAQIAINANSSVWRNAVDPDHEMVSEAFWDWWAPARGRVGLPPHRFTDLDHYADTIAELDLLYVRRPDGQPTFPDPPTFGEFLEAPSHPAQLATTDDRKNPRRVSVSPEPGDLDLHNSCYWYNARISRYFTVENRVNDQQPPTDLLLPAALTTGLTAALPEAGEALAAWDWPDLTRARPDAYRHGLDARVGDRPVTDLITQMLDVANLGLRRRGLDEERHLDPLRARFAARTNPAREARTIFAQGEAPALVAARTLFSKKGS